VYLSLLILVCSAFTPSSFRRTDKPLIGDAMLILDLKIGIFIILLYYALPHKLYTVPLSPVKVITEKL
jgi:hypothetical protein